MTWRPMTMAIEIDVQNATEFRPVPTRAEFHAWACTVLDSEESIEFTIRLVDERESRRLNEAYRGQDKPTNVLSFPAGVPAEIEIPLLGDIVICAPLVDAEAAAQGKCVEAHWAHLTIHGVLHLLGMDHQEASEAAQMEQREIDALASLGIANPYN